MRVNSHIVAVIPPCRREASKWLIQLASNDFLVVIVLLRS